MNVTGIEIVHYTHHQIVCVLGIEIGLFGKAVNATLPVIPPSAGGATTVIAVTQSSSFRGED